MTPPAPPCAECLSIDEAVLDALAAMEGGAKKLHAARERHLAHRATHKEVA